MKIKWLVILGLVLAALCPTAFAIPVTYFFTGTVSDTGAAPPCGYQPGETITGTFTFDFANENADQSTGAVGSASGWMSEFYGIDTATAHPLVFSTLIANCYISKPAYGSNFSMAEISPAGISANEAQDLEVVSEFNYTNASAATSVNGMPLFDRPGTGSALVHLGKGPSLEFIVNSMTFVPASIVPQLTSLTSETAATTVSGLSGKASTATSHAEAACTTLARLMSQAHDQTGAHLTAQEAAQLNFDTLTIEAEIGCQ
jgi:hypothetical protein